MIPAHRPYLGTKELEAMRRVFENRWLGMGPYTAQLEQRLAERIQARRVVLVSSCTAALHLALEALGIGPGDEVIVPSLTFAASVQAVRIVGATPVFCELP